MSPELKEIMQMLDDEIAARKSLPDIPEQIDAMRDLLFEAAQELQPVTVATLRHIASLKLRKDGVAHNYEVSGKQIRDVFEKHGRSDLLPIVQKSKK